MEERTVIFTVAVVAWVDWSQVEKESWWNQLVVEPVQGLVALVEKVALVELVALVEVVALAEKAGHQQEQQYQLVEVEWRVV